RGLREAGDAVDAMVILACDQPFVDAVVVGTLISAQEKTVAPIVACKYANTLGVPALFARCCFENLLALPDSSGAKSYLESRRADVVAINFEPGAVDIDTAEDMDYLNGLPAF
ncbi:MAG: NTP transferase domain-containing protein, partial [Chthoniobacterales bacterium]